MRASSYVVVYRSSGQLDRTGWKTRRRFLVSFNVGVVDTLHWCRFAAVLQLPLDEEEEEQKEEGSDGGKRRRRGETISLYLYGIE